MNKENYRPQTSIPARGTSQNNKKTLNNCISDSTLTPHSRKEYHDHYMRFLIASNAEYFHTKCKYLPMQCIPPPMENRRT